MFGNFSFAESAFSDLFNVNQITYKTVIARTKVIAINPMDNSIITNKDGKIITYISETKIGNTNNTSTKYKLKTYITENITNIISQPKYKLQTYVSPIETTGI